ncbi:FAD-dependent monooxygenase [Streptomyces sp. NRRL F-5193]|uniref:FAD-dependent monooxygenase n=1 Tax=Streptomyces sp. NRRL F-5193 TaxID=1463860 RepID=UPI000A8C1F94|nr:FAD-dependent monooxygenase [Streptomyces sp. NRRL F-5193]
MTHRNVLIAGAGIAGPALAHWLDRHGIQATLVERAPAPREGGQTVDLRGAGRDVARKMDLERTLRAHATREEGIRFVDAANRTKAAFTSGAFGGQGPIADLEILRADLSRILFEATHPHAEYLFGDEITQPSDTGKGADGAFRNGPGRAFDLVVAADGARSRTRDLIFGDTTDIRPVGLTTAYFTTPPAGSRTAPGPAGTTPLGDARRPCAPTPGHHPRSLSYLSPPRGDERLAPDAQKQLLRRLFTGIGWEITRILTAVDTADDFFLDSVIQVRMPSWSRGRIVVVGDAAYCASPLSGMGTSLALTGAYVLAGELAHHAHHGNAFARYEHILRPYIARAQHLPPGVPRIASPRTRAGIHALNTVLRAASQKPSPASPFSSCSSWARWPACCSPRCPASGRSPRSPRGWLRRPPPCGFRSAAWPWWSWCRERRDDPGGDPGGGDILRHRRAASPRPVRHEAPPARGGAGGGVTAGRRTVRSRGCGSSGPRTRLRRARLVP